MGPISNDLLIHFLKHRIVKAGLTLRGLAEQIHVAEADLQGLFDKKAFATPKLLARLSMAFGPDWKAIALKYMEWRFDYEFSKIGKPDEAPALPENLFQLLEHAKQFIRDNPMLGANELTELIKANLPLETTVIRNQIAHVRSQQSGDYRFYG